VAVTSSTRVATAESAGRPSWARSLHVPATLWKVLLQAASIWLATRAALAVFTYVTLVLNNPAGRNGDPSRPTQFGGLVHPADMMRAWIQYDSGWFMTIAQNNYTTASTTSFFPLYPLLIRLTTPLIGLAPSSLGALAAHRWELAALLVSNLAALLAFVGVALLVLHETGSNQTAWRTLGIMAAYPFAFFLAAAYSDAPFLAGAAFTLLFARRGQWVAAAAAAYLASITRAAGVILIMPLLWEYGRQHGWFSATRWRTGTWQIRRLFGEAALGLLVVGAVPLGVATYMAYLWYRFGNPLLLFAGQKEGWSRQTLLPWQTAQLTAAHLSAQPAWSYWQMMILFDVVLLLLFAVFTVILARRLPVSFTLYMLGLLYVCISTPAVQWVDPISGTVRFLTASVPIFFGLELVVERRPGLELFALGGGFLVQGAFASFFVTGGWLA
jgi:hypothetical protein